MFEMIWMPLNFMGMTSTLYPDPQLEFSLPQTLHPVILTEDLLSLTSPHFATSLSLSGDASAVCCPPSAASACCPGLRYVHNGYRHVLACRKRLDWGS
jgi:hypothetical protein